MALTQAYVNEVLNNLPSTVVVDDETWPELIRLLKFEGRDLTTLIVGRMKLRQATGGYDGLMTTLSALLKENESLRLQILALTDQVKATQATSPESALSPGSARGSSAHG